MFNGKSRKLAGLVILFSMFLVLLLSACTAPAQPIIGQGQTSAPIVVVTQVVVQVVATLPATNPPAQPSPTPNPPATPTVPTGWTPYNAPVYYPIVGCVASRLHIKDTAFVANLSRPLHLLSTKMVKDDPGKRDLALGEELLIYDGPWCVDGYMVWMVKTSYNEKGFVPEGDGNFYWLLPLKPTIPTPIPTIPPKRP